MAYKRMSRNDAYMNVANVEDDEDVIDLLEVARRCAERRDVYRKPFERDRSRAGSLSACSEPSRYNSYSGGSPATEDARGSKGE